MPCKTDKDLVLAEFNIAPEPEQTRMAVAPMI